MFYKVYVLYSSVDRKFYIGYTSDLERRIKEHQNGMNRSTKHRQRLELIYYEAFLDKKDSEAREEFLKSGSGHKFFKNNLKII